MEYASKRLKEIQSIKNEIEEINIKSLNNYWIFK